MFFRELRRRKVIRVAGVYAVVAWVLIEVVATIAPLLRLPEWTPTLVLFLLLVGFPLAVALAWAFDWTAEGLRRAESPAPVAESTSRGRAITYLALAILALAAGGVVYRSFGPGAETEDEAGDSPAERSIAVLPFANLSGIEENAYFSDGMTEDILTRLAQLGDLRVISRTSVMTYKDSDKTIREIAGELGVRYVLEGSVRRVGERVRITGQLIDAETDDHLWADSYDRQATDLLTLQGEIATEIADALRLRLSANERDRLARSATDNVVAYDLYLRGVDYLNVPGSSPAAYESNYAAAAALFRQALSEDSALAPAWAGLAQTYRTRSSLPLAVRYDSAVAFSTRATTLDPGLASGYVELGLAHALLGHNEEADRQIRRALELNPNDANAVAAIATSDYNEGRLDEALRGYRRAAALEPTDFRHLTNVGWVYMVLGELDEAEIWYRRMGEQGLQGRLECYLAELSAWRGRMDDVRRHTVRQLEYAPDAPYAWECAGSSYLVLREFERARELLERFAAGAPERNPLLIELAYLARESGDAATANRLLERAEARIGDAVSRTGPVGPHAGYELAHIAAIRGDPDAVAEHLRVAVDAGFRAIRAVEWSPIFDGVRDDPRIQTILAEVREKVSRMRERVRREGS